MWQKGPLFFVAALSLVFCPQELHLERQVEAVLRDLEVADAVVQCPQCVSLQSCLRAPTALQSGPSIY